MSSMTVLLLLVISKILTATAKEGLGKEEADAAGAIIQLFSKAVPGMDKFFKRQAEDGPLKHTTEAIVESFIVALKKHSVQPVDGKIKSAINTFVENTAPNFADKLKGGAERIIKEQLEQAIDLPNITDENALTILDQWTGSPLNNPIYKTLVLAFTPETWSEENTQDALQLYEAETSTKLAPYFIMNDADGMLGKGRRSFEASFWVEYVKRLNGPNIRAEQSALHLTKALTYQEAILRDMASWGSNHVFGNETYSQYIANNPPTTDDQITDVPFLPLEKMYVHPAYEEENKRIPDSTSILHTLLTSNERLQIILANFGMGKSLTSRMYAAKLAQAHLKNPHEPIPIYIVCRDCLDKKQPLVNWKKLYEASALEFFTQKNIQLTTEDEEFPKLGKHLPNKYIFILDGFDEIQTTLDQRQQWFDTFKATLGKNRCVIFSRPGVMGRIDYPTFATIRTLKSFNDAQTEEWVERWNSIRSHYTSALDPQVFIDQPDTLEGLAILIFMYALIYSENSAPPTNKADVYNRFILVVAAGKYQRIKFEQTAEKHKQIEKTNRLLRIKLTVTNEIIPPNQTQGPDAQPMIWLLSQLAWKERCLYTDEERHLLRVAPLPIKLTDRHLISILNNKLGIDTNEVEHYMPGAILAVQTNENFQNGILFKHKSFKEFLCAKRWMFALQKWMNGHFDKYADNDLYDAPLAHPSEETTDFLYDLIKLHKQHKSFNKQEAIGHLEKILNELEMCIEKPKRPQEQEEETEQPIDATKPIYDISWRIRRVLFQVLCWLHSEGNDINSYYTPNMKVFWALEFGKKFQDLRGLFLPRVNFSYKNLKGATLRRANLNGALLNGTELNRAELVEAELVGANLNEALLNGAALYRANLYNAKLNDAKLNRAELYNANLNRALLNRAKLNRAKIVGALLNDAELNRTFLNGALLNGALLNGAFFNNADLNGAKLNGAKLNNAELIGANLNSAELVGAELIGALLNGAFLKLANLNYAELVRANLSGANLSGANLSGAIFQNTKYNRTQWHGFGPTQWPEGFDPEEHEGLVAIEDLPDNE